MKLHPLFLQSIFLFSDSQYIKLAMDNDQNSDQCTFYNLLEQGLLKFAFGKLDNILITYLDKNGHFKEANIKKEQFFNRLYKNKCYKNKEQNILFTKLHLKKTIEQMRLVSPKTLNECKAEHKTLITNPLLPNLCKIADQLNKGRKSSSKILYINEAKNPKKYNQYKRSIKRYKDLKDDINFYHRNYLRNICSNISKVENFCKPFLKDDIWAKVLAGERPNYLIDYKCIDSLKMKGKNIKLTTKKRETCARYFSRNTNYCTNHGNRSFSSLFPMPKCDTINKALKVSRLKTDYHDCPGQIINESIINLHRLLSHVKERKIMTDSSSCTSESNYSFFKMNQEYKNNRDWPLQICYMNKVTEKEICTPYIPGENTKSKLSENKVIAEILHKTQATNFNINCKIISKKKYNPARLEFKSGCFVIYEKSNCTSLYCPKKVILDKKLIKHLKYKGKLLFEYIPNSITTKNFASTNIIEKVYKKRSKTILNLTQLKYYFNKKKDGIIHGIGCAEDLLPEFIRKESLNQCRPLPFIVDGITKDGRLAMRTAIDDLHSPRLIHWSFVFGAISSYKNIHPLKAWAFYGLY